MTDRRVFIGGSDAAAVLALHPYKTPLKLYLQKRGEDNDEPTHEDRQRDRALARGKREEPHIVDDLVKLCHINITKRSLPDAPNYYLDPECDFLAAEIDAEWQVTTKACEYLASQRGIEIPPELVGTTQNVEVKTAHPFIAWKMFGEEGTDEIPIEYFVQAMHGLMVSGRQICLVALGVYIDDPVLYLVRRDEERIAGIRDREVRFWLDNIQAGIPPAPVNLPDVYRMLKRRLATRVEATPQVEALVKSMRQMREKSTAYKEAADTLALEIGEFLLGAEGMEKPTKDQKGKHVITVNGKEVLSVRYQEQDRIDADMLRLKYPEVAVDCTKTTGFHSFNFPRSKL